MTATTGNSEHPLRSYDLAIDGPVLQAQRERLLEFAHALHQGEQLQLRPTDNELLEGLINLTNEIADQAADRYGIDCLLNIASDTARPLPSPPGTRPTKNPANLTREELVAIATGMVRILYGLEHSDGTWSYAADKPWCGSDVCEAVSTLLDPFGLVPDVAGDGQPMERPNS